MTKTPLKEGSEFAELTANLETNINRTLDETWGATQDPLPPAKARDLLRRAEAQIAEYEELLKAYSGGRRESIVAAGTQMDLLKEYAAELRVLVEKD